MRRCFLPPVTRRRCRLRQAFLPAVLALAVLSKARCESCIAPSSCGGATLSRLRPAARWPASAACSAAPTARRSGARGASAGIEAVVGAALHPQALVQVVVQVGGGRGQRTRGRGAALLPGKAGDKVGFVVGLGLKRRGVVQGSWLGTQEPQAAAKHG